MDRSFFRDLSTERLLLRGISPGDADFFYRVFSNPLVCRYTVDTEPFKSVDEAAGWIEWFNNDVLDHNRWVILNQDSGIPMGTCGFHVWDRRNKRVEVGYDLLPDYWGKGYMTEALGNALAFAFDEMEINRVCAFIHTANGRSANVAEKLGFRREGTLRELYFSGGRYHDHYVYALLKRDRTSSSSIVVPGLTGDPAPPLSC